MRKISILLCFFMAGCNAPPVKNIYRDGNYFNGGIDAPVMLLSSEWSRQPRTLASGWLVDGAEGIIFSAKHFSDDFMGNEIELGSNECKAFLAGKVYDCSVIQVPPLRDAVLLSLNGFDSNSLPRPYKISDEEIKMDETLFIEGMHPHPLEVSKLNAKDGFYDKIIPIYKDFYGKRFPDESFASEVVFDSLEAKVVNVDEHFRVDGQVNDPMGITKYHANRYVKVKTVRNHRFSFGGLSGGVAVRVNSKGEKEAVAIVTAEETVRFENDKKNKSGDKKIKISVADTISLTPITSVIDLVKAARNLR